MNKTIKITIPEPCHENWNAMTPTEKGRHCRVCTKEVIDFTTKSDQEVTALVSSSKNICGRMRTDQINRTITPVKKNNITTRLKSKKQNKTLPSYAAALLIPLAIGTMQNITAQNQESPTATSKTYHSLGIGSQHIQGEIISIPIAIVKGTVTNQEGDALAGAVVKVKNSSRIVQTDENGKFAIHSLPGDTLFFSYLGYETLERKVTSQETIHVALNKSAILEEPRRILVGRIHHK